MGKNSVENLLPTLEDTVVMGIDMNIALRRLPQNERRVVLLEYGGYTQREIGEVLGISQRHAGRTLKRAKSKLKVILA